VQKTVEAGQKMVEAAVAAEPYLRVVAEAVVHAKKTPRV
jgi:hypothetical protein